MIKVLTYNVHRWVGLDRRTSPERAAAVIAASGARIVALQEVKAGKARMGWQNRAEAVARSLGMTLHFQPTARIFGEQLGLAIMTDLPSRRIKGERLPSVSVDGGISKRSALWIEVDYEGLKIQVINTHLSLRPNERLMQAQTLLGEEWLGHEKCANPVIFMGDFNASPNSRSYRLITESFGDAQLMSRSALARPTFHARMPLVRLDHIFLRGEMMRVTKARPVHSVLTRSASDHLPLLAHIAFNRSIKAGKREA
ncbi:endonuclease/exonuclease/phosphatase family protein [Microvirga sp. W0021]|uniref:Endonuclease/exonuclease/phosphatase family protein n=1 Tax=Hohaiivirga grylli TaxID=3133970 RepID=A0ABV0BHS4_9HYPH